MGKRASVGRVTWGQQRKSSYEPVSCAVSTVGTEWGWAGPGLSCSPTMRDVNQLETLLAVSSEGRNSTFFFFLKSEHPLHLRHLISRVTGEVLPWELENPPGRPLVQLTMGLQVVL